MKPVASGLLGWLAFTAVCAFTLFACGQDPPAVKSGKAPAKAEAAKADETPQKVNGLELFLERDEGPVSLPVHEVDPAEKFVTFRVRAARFVPPPVNGVPIDPEEKVAIERAEWVVTTVGKNQPKIREEQNDQNTLVHVGLPESGEALLVSVNALVKGGEKTWVTKHAQAMVLVSGGRGAPEAEPDRPTAVPQGVTGLHVIVVVPDRTNPTPEFKALIDSKAVPEALKASGSNVYVVDQNSNLARRNDVAAVVRSVGVPCVIVAGPDGRLLPNGNGHKLAAQPFDGKADARIARRNETALLDLVGRAAGGR